jgi:hypothetical protein
VVAVRWYLRFSLSYRDVEELLVERGVEVDHVTVFRWVQRFVPLLSHAARSARHFRCDRWVRGRDIRHGLRDLAVRVPRHRSGRAGHRRTRLRTSRRGHGRPVFPPRVDHVEGDATRGGHRRRWDLPAVRAELIPSACHHVKQTSTIRSRPTAVNSNTGSNRCAGSERIGAPS